MSQLYQTTAVFNEKINGYDHFNIHKVTASLYGHKANEIINLNIKISDDQTIPKDGKLPNVDYWGWLDEKGRFSLIYCQYFILNMCFPYGIKASEDRNQGKAYRIEIVSVI